MNLSEMLREQDPVCERRSVTPEEWQTHGKWTQYGIGTELAELVEADSELVDAVVALAHGEHCDCDLCGAVRNVTAASAALVAKLEGRS